MSWEDVAFVWWISSLFLFAWFDSAWAALAASTFVTAALFAVDKFNARHKR